MRIRIGLLASLLALITVSTAAAGTSIHTFRLRWPPHANQTFNYGPSNYGPSFRVTGKVRSISLRYKGAIVPRGFVLNYIVDCAHRGPAFLDWDWVQQGNDVLLRVQMTSGLCNPGPGVAGTLATLRVTVTSGG